MAYPVLQKKEEMLEEKMAPISEQPRVRSVVHKYNQQ